MEFIILTGHRKSGTTLLSKLFDGHPEINVYPVDLSLLYAFYPCWIGRNKTKDEIKNRVSLVVKKSTEKTVGKCVSDAVNCFDADEFLWNLWNICDPNELSNPSHIVRLIGEAYLRYTKLPKNKPFLFKETSQTVNLQNFIDNGLNLKMVQIVRDPRDNFAAIRDGISNYYQEMGEGELESIASVLNRAKLDLELAKAAIITNNPYFNAVRFEDLVSEPEKTMKSIACFLKIRWNDSLLQPTTLSESYLGNNHAGLQFHGVSKHNLGRWRDRITEADACLIEGWMLDIMKYWNYTPQYQTSAHLRQLAEFYAWYNCKYFYYDSFRAADGLNDAG